MTDEFAEAITREAANRPLGETPTFGTDEDRTIWVGGATAVLVPWCIDNDRLRG